jgi:hypothetical protein
MILPFWQLLVGEKGGLMRYAPMKLRGIGQQIIVRKSTSSMIRTARSFFARTDPNNSDAESLEKDVSSDVEVRPTVPDNSGKLVIPQYNLVLEALAIIGRHTTA